MTNAFILCDLIWKVQKCHAANREGTLICCSIVMSPDRRTVQMLPIPIWPNCSYSKNMKILYLLCTLLIRLYRRPQKYPISRVLISWIYSCNTYSYIRSVYNQCHVDSLKYTDQNVNNQTLTQVTQLYVHVSSYRDSIVPRNIYTIILV